MPTITRYFIKAALLYLVAALLIGALVLLQPLLHLPDALAAFSPVYFHLLMVGWVTQLIMGVAYWMFPKQSKERQRGAEWIGWTVLALLNAGLLLRLIAEPLQALRPDWNAGWLLAVSAVAQLVAGWAFVANTWTRVKER